ncbi:GAL1/galactokinase [Blumeria hordei DH14]|uniref:Galactokinase n=1 Tax=Blumeria graminis f. sp. hordei (strain DH14) TaxID=546991 RepID=N1J677_BLUG1|nr:GAL1/galactokinase [Blumeria hordei DH14]
MSSNVLISESLDDIYSPDVAHSQRERWQNLINQFRETYGKFPAFVSRSPGRVNIIGEHIDYSLYSVLPMAITADVLLAVSTNDSDASDGYYRIKISNVESQKFESRSFEIPYGKAEIDSTSHIWTNYFKAGLNGAVELLTKIHGQNFQPKCMEILLDGNLPAGGGLSSSAAFVTASALAVMYANNQTCIDKTTLTELAITSERAVGVNAGGMDQAASVFSSRGSLLHVSFSPRLRADPIKMERMDPEASFLVAQSFVKSDKFVTGPVCYNLRVVECSMAAAYLYAFLKVQKKVVAPLPEDSGPLGISLHGFQAAYFAQSDLSFVEQLSQLLSLTKTILSNEIGYTLEEIAMVVGCTVWDLKKKFMSVFPVRAERFMLRQRALHVFSEASRVLEFINLLNNQTRLKSSGLPLSESLNADLGNLMNASQDSCRELFDCSSPELDDLCRIAREAGAYGSRLTGAGWGGCTVHLVPNAKIKAVRKAWHSLYYSKQKLTEDELKDAIVESKPGGGSIIYEAKKTPFIEIM